MDKTQFALEDLKNIQELIRFTDQKAGAVLVVYIFILTTFINMTIALDFINPFTLDNPQSMIFSCLTFLTSAALVALMVFQIYYIIFKVLRPRMAQEYRKGEGCVFYFDHINNMAKNDFIRRFNDIKESKLLDEITSQVYEVAKILCEKNRKFKIVLRCLFISLIMLLSYIIFFNLL